MQWAVANNVLYKISGLLWTSFLSNNKKVEKN